MEKSLTVIIGIVKTNAYIQVSSISIAKTPNNLVKLSLILIKNI
jgi:hypothetical protein